MFFFFFTESKYKLLKLEISNYHNKSFSIDFTDAINYNTRFFIGQNGSYKSTMLELIYTIFASFSAPSVIDNNDFDYSIYYKINGNIIYINKDAYNYRMSVCDNVDDIPDEDGLEVISLNSLRKKLEYNELLPKRIFSFYSGENDRMKKLSMTALRGYNRSLQNAISKDFSPDTILPTKRFIHSDRNRIPIFLVIAMNDNNTRLLIKNYCQIDSLDKLLFQMDLKNSVEISENMTKKQYSMELIKRIDKDIYNCMNFIEFEPKKSYGICYELDLNKNKFDSEKIFRFVEALNSAFNLTTYISFKIGDATLWDKALSQGQRQWITILGMMELSRTSSPSLFLMDEPDAFMNPIWKYEFNKTIASQINPMAEGETIIVTHDPLLINGVAKEQVSIFEKKDDVISITHPEKDTIGLGIDGILRSQYYGLNTTLDQQTTEKYYKRMELYSKALNNELTDEEDKEQLYELTKEMGTLPAFRKSIDNLYADFLREYRKSQFADEPYLSKEQIEERRSFIKDTIESLYKRENR